MTTEKIRLKTKSLEIFFDERHLTKRRIKINHGAPTQTPVKVEIVRYKMPNVYIR